MTRNGDELKLRDAFRQEPEACHQALMKAAGSVKEDETVRRINLPAALLAALMMLAMMTAALAGGIGGLNNWFQGYYHATLPVAAQDVMDHTQRIMLEAGNAVFSINEFLCDGKILYMTASVKSMEAGGAILYPQSDDPYGRIGEAWAQQLDHPEINAKTTYLEAAQITGLPLYCVDAWVMPQCNAALEASMGDGRMQDDGALLMVSMQYFRDRYEGDVLPATVSVHVQELDTSTLELMEERSWSSEAQVSIAVHGVTAEKSYVPETETRLSQRFILQGVTAKQSSAGIYIYIAVQAEGDMTVEEMHAMNFEWNVLNEQGKRYPVGISLTRECLDGTGRSLDGDMNKGMMLKDMQYMLMITADELPDTFVITDGENNVTVR